MMDFMEAAKRAVNGEQMERTSINDSVIIMSFELENLRFRNSKGTDKSDCVSAIDITSDWKPHEEHFDLSKKIITKFDTEKDESADSLITTPIDVIEVKHIKEFIKKINTEMKKNESVIEMIECQKVELIIDKLAGERFK